MAGPCPLLGRQHSSLGCCKGTEIKAWCWQASGVNLSEIGPLLFLLLMVQLVFSGMFRCLASAGTDAPLDSLTSLAGPA